MCARIVIKRILDILFAVAGLVVLLPVFIVISLLIFFDLGLPVLFRQVRPGLDGEPFVLYKFRTMKDIKDKKGNLLPDGQRITGLGRFLRSTSLDELPELWKVLKGEIGRQEIILC